MSTSGALRHRFSRRSLLLGLVAGTVMLAWRSTGYESIPVALDPANRNLSDPWITVQQALGDDEPTFGIRPRLTGRRVTIRQRRGCDKAPHCFDLFCFVSCAGCADLQ
jgi:hypothetical protein